MRVALVALAVSACDPTNNDVCIPPLTYPHTLEMVEGTWITFELALSDRYSCYVGGAFKFSTLPPSERMPLFTPDPMYWGLTHDEPKQMIRLYAYTDFDTVPQTYEMDLGIHGTIGGESPTIPVTVLEP